MVDFAQLRWSFLANRGFCVATLILASLQFAPKFALMLVQIVMSYSTHFVYINLLQHKINRSDVVL